MAGNGEYQAIGGGRFVLVDPNKFTNQYTGVRQNDLYNFSVPLEDLCIDVELKTYKKNRTLLLQDGNGYSSQNQNSGPTGIVMIPTGQKYNIGPDNRVTPDDPTNDSGYLKKANWLTTSYTNISTQVGEDDDEVLGMTNIEISFDSQMAPLINIDFIDPRGAAIFQNGGRSKYSVFFTLPYPLFELTIKGFYGKPVKFCLHLTKFNSRFNSQTGNFEISTKFVGYTYALLSDMIFGYLRAITETPDGAKLLAEKKPGGVIKLNDFLINSSSIDEKIKEVIGNTENPSFNDLKILQETDTDYNNIISLINEYVKLLKESQYGFIESPNGKIIIVENKGGNIQLGSGEVSDPENEKKITEFETKFKEIANRINGKVGDDNDLKIDVSKEPILPRFSTQFTVIESYFSTNLSADLQKSVNSFTDLIKQKYNVTESEDIKEIVNLLKDASTNVQANPLIKYYDFDRLYENILISQSLLSDKIREIRKESSLTLQETLRDALNFDTSIRSIFEILTTHVDIFLELLYNVSKTAEANPARKEQLKKFIPNLDILEKKENDQTEQPIYPWPEYYEGDEEKYLGSQPGPLTDPSVVDEIKFVDLLFEGLIKSRRADEIIKSGINNENQSWFSFNPADCKFYYDGDDQINPYQRLGDNPQPVDVARLFVLRAFAFFGTNFLLLDEEIDTFVNNESSLIIKQFKDNAKILQGLNQNFTTVDQFLSINGSVGLDDSSIKEVKIISSANTGSNIQFEYDYIYKNILTNIGYRLIIPISDSFTNKAYPNPYASTGLVEPPRLYISNVTYKNQDPGSIFPQDQINDLPSDFDLSDVPSYISKLRDNAFYIKIIPKEKYGDSSVTNQTKTFSSSELNQLFNTKDIVGSQLTLGSGKYGVLEFSKIKFDQIAVERPFYTLFYGNHLGFSKYNTEKGREISSSVYNTNNNEIPLINIELLEEASEIIGSYHKIEEQSAIYYDSITNNIGNFNETDTFIPNFGFSLATFTDGSNLGIASMPIPLFGSRFYYGQKSDEAKAFLFLHCFPWKGLSFGQENFSDNVTGNDIDKIKLDFFGLLDPKDNYGLNSDTPLLNCFQFRSGFIQAPKLWSAFVGGLLWRYLLQTDPITWFYTETTNNSQQPLIKPYYATTTNTTHYPPAKDQYLKSYKSFPSMSFFSDYDISVKYKKIESVILRLPDPVKITFLTAFLNFVEQEFKPNIKGLFELKYNGNELNASNWTNAINAARTSASNNNGNLRKTDNPFTANKPINEVFDMFTIYKSDKQVTDVTGGYFSWGNDAIFFTYKKGSEQSNKLIQLFTEYEYIANGSPRIWNRDKEFQGAGFIDPSAESSGVDSKFKMPSGVIQKMADKFKENIASEVGSAEGLSYSKDELEQIKFQIYRNCKAIYDKWIAGSNNEKDSIFQCCKTQKEKEVVDSTYSSGGALKLIDSFHFVNRSFQDIGDLSQINPLSISKQVVDNSNISFYQVINRVLTDNNFVFVPLPSFINYNNTDDLMNMFRPIPCKEAANEVTTGPAFVCTYVGQTSTKLDLQNPDISQHKNDSFDFTRETDIPSDFKGTKEEGENTCAAFIVRYGQQNQNIFKDINLDQSEFNETDESLQVTDNIANQALKPNRTFIGQNLYSVYSVRSYSAEVEMMGNAQIQPMMYFQLENIPMFHGAYIITRVSHSIKPNYMSTRFKGTRIKKKATPIVDAQALYGSILDGYDLGGSTGRLRTGKTYTVRPLIQTLIKNEAKNAYLRESFGQVTMKKVPDIKGVLNSKRGSNTGSNDNDNNIEQLSEYMITEAADALEKMLKDFVASASTNSFPKVGDNYIGITSLYRNYKKQRSLVKSNKGSKGAVAGAGTSYHGWGVAVDLQMVSTKNEFFQNSTSNKDAWNLTKNPTLAWLYENAWKYGFWLPAWAKDGAGVDEFWHFEYHGTSVVCLWKSSPDDAYGNRVKMPDDAQNQLDPIVLNPKEPDGNRAVYDPNSCEEVTIKTGDGTNENTKIDDPKLNQNMLTIKQYLKKYFTDKKYETEDAKALTAGIMGNINKETRPKFDPNSNTIDTNGKLSYGLIQWNARYYENIKEKVGNTAESQIVKVVDGYTNYYKDFEDEYNAKSTINGQSKAWTAAFYFAKNVERCSYCIKDDKASAYDNYTTGGVVQIQGKSPTVLPSQRSEFADSFFSRFNDPNDFLYWDSDIKNIADYKAPTPSISSAPNTAVISNKKVVTIGDSLSVGLSTVYPQIFREQRLSDVGWTINKLITEIKKLSPDFNTIAFTDVIISIGSNDGWQTTQDKVLILLKEIDRVYTNSKRIYILNGNYGWGNLAVSGNRTDDYWKKEIDKYTNLFINSGQIKIGQDSKIGTIVKSTSHPSPTASDAFFADKKADLESKGLIPSAASASASQNKMKPLVPTSQPSAQNIGTKIKINDFTSI